jgi:hypothetical protein
MGQGGNIWGWQESAYDGVNNSADEDRGMRGGIWDLPVNYLRSSSRSSILPSYDEGTGIGFRVASVADVVPEPSTYALFGLGAIGMLMVLRRKKKTA